MLQFLRYLLFPFSLVYKGITSFRNLLFDFEILPSLDIPLPSIGVGNLTVGGTGKTPIIDYLIKMVSDKKTGVISRGYGRNTKGFIELNDHSNVKDVGDEPFMLQKKNKNIKVFVSENRVEGYKKAMECNSNLEFLLFDDVFQHRYVKPKINLLLCDYNRPFYEDYVLPTGLLRESRSGAKRAEIVVVTKCPVNLSITRQNEIKDKIQKYSLEKTPIFFAHFKSESPQNQYNESLETGSKIVLISGLANNEGFRNTLQADFEILKHHEFKDHHDYSKTDIGQIISEFRDTYFVCTEKDFVKIEPFLGDDEIGKFFVSRQKVMFFDEIFFKKLILQSLGFT